MAEVKVNGKQADAGPNPQQLAELTKLIEALQPQIETMHGVMIRGVVVQCQGVPAHVIANIYAAACA